MEGYSVTEAASVLGVPVERVWELLARGVLAGAPEGETGMRVFLQPRHPAAPPREEAERPNGNGGAREPERELSPFRELLTEFRNLTERYGQALLALGESRGEVASLRSRVDLLEARMDLRLPGGGAPPTAGWSTATAPFAAERTVMPAPASAADHDPTEQAAGSPGAPDDIAEHRARARGPRRATESFAEALARAEDPSAAELPGSAEVAQALAALRHEPPEATEAILPRELPAADEVPVADEREPVEEPAEAWREPEVAAQSGPEPAAAAEPEIAQAEPEPGPDAEVASVEPVPGPEPVAAVEAEAEPLPEPPEGGPEPATEAEPPSWDIDRYTAAIGEPDWFEAEALDAEPASPPEEATAALVDDGGASEMESLGSSAAPAAAPASEPPAPEAAAPEPAPAPGRTVPEATPGLLPGSSELSEALAALDAIGDEPAAPSEADAPAPAPEPSAAPIPASALRYRPIGPPAGPAGRAYRRLRRIFPD